MRIFLVAPLLALSLLLAACAPGKKLNRLQVEVNKNAFILNGQSYRDPAELTAAIKALPRPDIINLAQAADVDEERRNAALFAIIDSESGTPVNVFMVGSK
jgi:hypothetical protein